MAVALGPRVLAERELSADRRHAAELLPAIRDLCVQSGWAVDAVQALCFSHGPGSFTGLRVAATVARMFHWTTGCRIVAVPTLEIVAANVMAATPARGTASCGTAVPAVFSKTAADAPQANKSPEGKDVKAIGSRPMRVAVIVNAGRRRVFGALYESANDDQPRELQPVAVRHPADWIPAIEPPFVAVGEAVEEHRAVCERAGAVVIDDASLWRPTARGVARLGHAMLLEGRVCRPEDIRPLYIRRPEAEEVYEQRRAEARARRGE